MMADKTLDFVLQSLLSFIIKNNENQAESSVVTHDNACIRTLEGLESSNFKINSSRLQDPMDSACRFWQTNFKPEGKETQNFNFKIQTSN